MTITSDNIERARANETIGYDCIAKNHYREAIKRLTIAIDNNPGIGNYYLIRADAYYAVKDYPLAEEDYRSGIARLDTKDWESFYVFAETLNIQGKYTEAIKYCNLAIKYYPKKKYLAVKKEKDLKLIDDLRKRALSSGGTNIDDEEEYKEYKEQFEITEQPDSSVVDFYEFFDRLVTELSRNEYDYSNPNWRMRSEGQYTKQSDILLLDEDYFKKVTCKYEDKIDKFNFDRRTITFKGNTFVSNRVDPLLGIPRVNLNLYYYDKNETLRSLSIIFEKNIFQGLSERSNQIFRWFCSEGNSRWNSISFSKNLIKENVIDDITEEIIIDADYKDDIDNSLPKSISSLRLLIPDIQLTNKTIYDLSFEISDQEIISANFKNCNIVIGACYAIAKQDNNDSSNENNTADDERSDFAKLRLNLSKTKITFRGYGFVSAILENDLFDAIAVDDASSFGLNYGNQREVDNSLFFLKNCKDLANKNGDPNTEGVLHSKILDFRRKHTNLSIVDSLLIRVNNCFGNSRNWLKPLGLMLLSNVLFLCLCYVSGVSILGIDTGNLIKSSLYFIAIIFEMSFPYIELLSGFEGTSTFGIDQLMYQAVKDDAFLRLLNIFRVLFIIVATYFLIKSLRKFSIK